jgi:hypothetical protein
VQKYEHEAVVLHGNVDFYLLWVRLVGDSPKDWRTAKTQARRAQYLSNQRSLSDLGCICDCTRPLVL